MASAEVSPAKRLRVDGAGRDAPAPVHVAQPPNFKKDFSKPMAIPEDGIAEAVKVMQSGRLFRYCAKSADESQVAQAEVEFAAMVGAKYALGVNSCSSAMMLTLKSVDVKEGTKVLTNGFTFTAIPSTIMRIGGVPVLVETTPSWTMDLDDLERKAVSSGAKVLLLSHMRGKVTDMDRVVALCKTHGIRLIEDCAHSCGVKWRGKQLGYLGEATAYSTQSDKVINSGEGGFFTTNSDEMMAKALYYSGCYERRYAKHALRPPDELLEAAMLTTPNLSMRMSELTGACVRPLIRSLPARVEQYNRRYDSMVQVLRAEAGQTVTIPEQLALVSPVGDHLNFFLAGVTPEQNARFKDVCNGMGVPINWLSGPINARYHVNWRKYGSPTYELPGTDKLLSTAYDLKLPPYFEDEDFVHIAKVIAYSANVAAGKVKA
jgi:dTDP-4-amino-4,6-dideoxygalactose transaminase